jgi:hypothetical protein
VAAEEVVEGKEAAAAAEVVGEALGDREGALSCGCQPKVLDTSSLYS